MCIISKELLLFGQILGIFPFRFNYDSTVLIFSKSLLVRGVILGALVSVQTILALLRDFTGKLNGNPIRMFSGDAVLGVFVDLESLNIMVFSIILSNFMKHKNLVEACRIFSTVDHLLPVSSEDNISNSRLKITLLLVGYSIFLVITFLTELYSTVNTSIGRYFLSYPPVIFICYLAVLYFTLNINHVTRQIAERFRQLNEEIEIEIINHRSFRMNKITQMDQGMLQNPQSSRVRTLMDLYWLLCDGVSQANQYYNVQIFTAAWFFFLQIIITFSYLIHQFKGFMDMSDVPNLVMLVTWGILHMLQLVRLVSGGSAVTEAAEETGPMICKLLTEDLSPYVKQELDTFLIQLLHHNARFSALGFFQVQNHVLTSIAGSVATYMVILIQFQS